MMGEMVIIPKSELIPMLRDLIREELRGKRNSNDPEELLSVEEVAELLGYSTYTIYERKREIGFHKVGRKIRFKKADVMTFINNAKI